MRLLFTPFLEAISITVQKLWLTQVCRGSELVRKVQYGSVDRGVETDAAHLGGLLLGELLVSDKTSPI